MSGRRGMQRPFLHKLTGFHRFTFAFRAALLMLEKSTDTSARGL